MPEERDPIRVLRWRGRHVALPSDDHLAVVRRVGNRGQLLRLLRRDLLDEVGVLHRGGGIELGIGVSETCAPEKMGRQATGGAQRAGPGSVGPGGRQGVGGTRVSRQHEDAGARPGDPRCTDRARGEDLTAAQAWRGDVHEIRLWAANLRRGVCETRLWRLLSKLSGHAKA